MADTLLCLIRIRTLKKESSWSTNNTPTPFFKTLKMIKNLCLVFPWTSLLYEQASGSVIQVFGSAPSGDCDILASGPLQYHQWFLTAALIRKNSGKAKKKVTNTRDTKFMFYHQYFLYKSPTNNIFDLVENVRASSVQ